MEHWQSTAQVAPQIGLYGLRGGGGLGDRTWQPTAAVDPKIGIFGRRGFSGAGAGLRGYPPTRPPAQQDLMRKMASGDTAAILAAAQIGQYELGSKRGRPIAQAIANDIAYAKTDPAFVSEFLGPVGMTTRQLAQSGQINVNYVQWVERNYQKGGFSLDDWAAGGTGFPAGVAAGAAVAGDGFDFKALTTKPWFWPVTVGALALLAFGLMRRPRRR